MNGKIPVFGAVASAYGFAFGNFLTVLRLSWFWLAVLAALNIYWGPKVMAATIEGFKAFETGGPQAMAAAMSGVQFESNILQLLGGLSNVFILVALVRAAISRDNRDGVPLHIVSGMPDLRVIGVMILLLIAAVAGAFGIALVFGLLRAALNAAGGGAVIGILALVLVVTILWVTLRLSLVLPVAAVEPSLGVERSWSLMKGNSIRMFFAYLMTFIPFGVGVAFAIGALLGPDVIAGFPQLDQSNPQAFQAAIFGWFASLVERVSANLPVWIVAGSVINMIYFGLIAGLLGRAYRATTGMDG